MQTRRIPFAAHAETVIATRSGVSLKRSMRTRLRAVPFHTVLVLVVAASACSESEIGFSPPGPTVYLRPVEGTTAYDPQHPLTGIGLGIDGIQIDPAIVNDVGSQLSLRTWPELELIPSMMVIRDPASSPTGWTELELRPQMDLSERWYVVATGALPSTWEWARGAQPIALPNGQLGGRFRVGSEPSLWGVTACQKGSNTWSIEIAFSERITVADAAASPVELTQAGAQCTTISGPAGAEVSMACTNLDTNAPLTVGVMSGLLSAVSSQPVPPVTITITISQLENVAPGCWFYRRPN